MIMHLMHAWLLLLLLFALQKVHVRGVVQTQNVDVEFHLFHFDEQLLLGFGAIIIGIEVAVPDQGVLSAHEKVDGALVVLGGGSVGATLVMQGAERQVMFRCGHELG